MASENSMGLINRRQFLAYSAAGAAGLLLPMRMADAGVMDTLKDGLEFASKLTKLHPVRFIGGVVFDLGKAVVVELAADYIVDKIKKGIRPDDVELADTSGTESVAEFRHTNYKASTIILGEADYTVTKDDQLSLTLIKSEQEKRYQKMLDYLRANENRKDIAGITFAGMKSSVPIPEYLEPDKMFTLDYIQIRANKEQHYYNIVNEVDVTAFNSWRV